MKGKEFYSPSTKESLGEESGLARWSSIIDRQTRRDVRRDPAIIEQDIVACLVFDEGVAAAASPPHSDRPRMLPQGYSQKHILSLTRKTRTATGSNSLALRRTD